MVFKLGAVLVLLYVASAPPCVVMADGDSPTYKFVLDQLLKEQENTDIIATDLTFDKEGSEVKISGEVKQLLDLDDEWKVNVVMFRADSSDGEFSKMMTMPEKGVCAMLKSYYKMYFYDSLKNYSNAPEPSKCPVVKETYVINAYPLDSSKFQKFLKLGYYRIVMTLSNNGEEKIKYVLEGHVEEAEA